MKNYFLFLFAMLLSLSTMAHTKSAELSLKTAYLNQLPCNNQATIEKLKEDLCIGFCISGTIFHAEYFGRPVLLVREECLSYNSSFITESLYSCEGDWINFDEAYLTIKAKIYECPTEPKECDNDRVINGIKANMCSNCEEEQLYHATYNGESALYLTRSCPSLPDLPTQVVYNCYGEIIGSLGFWSNDLDGSLEIQSLIHSCTKSTGNNNNCSWGDDFESYRSGAKVAYDNEGGNSEKWHRWSNNSPSGVVTANKTLEFNNRKYGFQDVVFNLGIQSTNIYKVSWKMYIESNSLAYFNVQHTNNSNDFISGGKYKVTFRETSARYQNRWFDVDLYVDLDRNKLKLVVDNGRDVLERNYTSTLGGINFAAYPNAHFYIDDICMQEVNQIPLTSEEGQASSRSKINDLEISTVNNNTVKEATTNSDSFKVFPNPSRGMTTVQFEQDNGEDLSIEVFNQTGQLVKQLPVGTSSYINQAIDLSDLPNGMYIVKLRGATTNLQQKLLLQQ